MYFEIPRGVAVGRFRVKDTRRAAVRDAENLGAPSHGSTLVELMVVGNRGCNLKYLERDVYS
jgi:hypothetical protein